MKGNCGECARRWACDIDPDQCNEWPDPAPEPVVDHFRSMTDEELAGFLDEYGGYTICNLVCGGGCNAISTLTETAEEKCRKHILEVLRKPYKGESHGQAIGNDTEA